MTKKWFILLLAIATGVNVMWAGAATFRVLIDLPARHRLGPLVFAELSRATDLDRGLVFYPIAGVGSALLAGAACLIAVRTRASHFVHIQTAVANVAWALVALLTNLRAIFIDLGSLGLFCAMSSMALRAAATE